MKNIEKNMFFIFSGLPGVGKTSLSQSFAAYNEAAYLRIDTIEQALRDLCQIRVESEGYKLAYRLASDNLLLGLNVVADSCNPVRETRQEWEQVAIGAGVDFINIEIICSDTQEHRTRVETRRSTIEDLVQPSWKQVQEREYDRWDRHRITLDTAGRTSEESFSDLLAAVSRH